MYNIPIIYEVILTKEASIDIDLLIDLVIKEAKEDNIELCLSDIMFIFDDNLYYYLMQMEELEDVNNLPTYVEDEIYSKFTTRLLERFPELNED